MTTERIINKYRKMVLEKLDEILSKNKFQLNFKSLEFNIDENFDKLIDDGLKFNINKSIVKKFLYLELERIAYKMEIYGIEDSFDIIFHLNEINEDNEVFSELVKYKLKLDSEIYRPILEKMYNQDG